MGLGIRLAPQFFIAPTVMKKILLVCMLASLSLILCRAEPLPELPAMQGVRVGVFVSLCDNEYQGIAPVPTKIGRGDEPSSNLYWGCADAVGPLLRRSAQWRRPVIFTRFAGQGSAVLEALQCVRADGRVTLRAFAYQGREQKQCLRDAEEALSSGAFDLVIFVGHNGLMDFDLPAPRASVSTCDVAVLCCQSQAYFEARLRGAGHRPVLLTRSNMYPGGFIVLALVESYVKFPRNLTAHRSAAAAAYAKNQGISQRAALSVFAEIKE